MSKNNRQQIDQNIRLRNWAGIIYTIASAIIISFGTYFTIRWAKGDFRLDQNADLISRETGILHATSNPKAAQVYINDKLTSATDNIIYLAPGEYQVVIQKDGYNSWQKNIKVEKGLVSQTNATLFPFSPNLTSLTFNGIQEPLPSPDGSKILFYTDTASIKSKNGLYIFDLNNSSKNIYQLTANNFDFPLSESNFLWSPDSSEILIITPNYTYLINSNSYTDLNSSPDVSLQLDNLFSSWEKELALRERQFLEKISPLALNTIFNHAQNIFISPDKTKILYTATASATLADNLIPALPARNSYPENRQLLPGSTYVYDGYEDKNYLIESSPLSQKDLLPAYKKILNPSLTLAQLNTPTAPTIINQLKAEDFTTTLANFQTYYGHHSHQPWFWLSDSNHLVKIIDQQIIIINYDGSNYTPVYSGPFNDNFLLPHTNGNSLIILTSFSPDSPANLYAIELKK